MNILTLWIQRKDGGPPELIEAWDEFSIDENPDGARASFKEAREKNGDDVDEFRYITLDIPIQMISGAFDPLIIKVT